MNRWHLNTGTTPRDKSAEVVVIWANHQRARFTYKVSQLVWQVRGWEYDIKWFCKANAVPAGLPFTHEEIVA